ncbi:STAS/SEC14 domain-containing protein [Roseovarius arcticus]|uniref:STAS/SEC14 domain-containing protein n=1 Tax=Roseovarius arcticus TaxID=2547404 RepID=UPI0011102C82|nr:STAS/SEC14 domain-containing protein [Roseovarius arcticus]
MKPIVITKDKNVLRVQINQSLSKDMVSTLRGEIDGFINEHDHIPNLVISCMTAPRWDSLRAFADYVDMVHDHHKLIKKVALVGDNAMFSVLPKLVDHFVGAKLRHFKKEDLTGAVEWANEPGDAAGAAFHLLDGFPSDVIAMEAVGEISSRDYDVVVVPLIEQKLKEHDKLKLFFKLGTAFESYSMGAAWDDLRLGLKHPLSFSKMRPRHRR